MLSGVTSVTTIHHAVTTILKKCVFQITEPEFNMDQNKHYVNSLDWALGPRHGSKNQRNHLALILVLEVKFEFLRLK